MGFDMSRCFATSIDANSEFTTHIPDHWSMDDGVTVLSTYSTVWYGLIERALLQKSKYSFNRFKQLLIELNFLFR